ncbi:TPA: DnaJ domain-containing protein [Neisseria subflava]|jgi:dnaJ-family protein|uniref:DnaJ domain-containing protein n=1 Tax=Neisseria TaxID=482 RepID=UPI0001A810A4|nr:DnaJ domain-containing protein [Neisseria subflava]EER57242.1 DnaJ domain protein [Neisseria flavescens SK114]MCL9764161.1 DnaJ domain-containing protein [Neisseria subflava]MCL9787054.1 DnaJ domain-containing protein [Neisseria subflava]
MEQLNLYEILGVSQDADINVIREAYGKLVANPDIQKDAERFKAIGQAFEVLSHPEKRLAYDAAMQYERQETNTNNFTDMATNVVNAPSSDVKNYVFIAYVTYAVGLLILFTPVVGVIMAYVKRDEAQGSIYASHIDYLIKTFWVSLVGTVLGTFTTLILIGWLILLVTAIWFIYRVVIGLIKLNEDKPVSTQGWF